MHSEPAPPAEVAAFAIVAKFVRLADIRGFIEIRPNEVEQLARDLGYRTNHWPHGDALHWLAAMLATAGKHPVYPDFRYRSGFCEPVQVGSEYLSRSLNVLLAAR